MCRPAGIAIVALSAALGGAVAWAQSSTIWVARDHAAVQYSTREPRDPIARLNARLAGGEARLEFAAPPRGYLASVLKALDIPVSSQTLVYSENSLQGPHISMKTPRAIYFNDTVSVGWANGASTIEVTALDPTLGVQFYSIAQSPGGPARFTRRNPECLQCHLMPQTHGVPGLVTMSQLPLSDNRNEYAQGWATDHRTPIEDRWGGWYVTGAQVPVRHLGNVPVMHVPKSYVRADVAPRVATVAGAVDAAAYLSPHSDVTALLVLNHQVHMTNLITRLGWQARIAAHDAPGRTGLPPHVRDTAHELVDYLLFVDEAPLPSAVKGSSSFAQEFAARGPRDSQGRSLRDFDLTRRLFRHPCSYMIYTEAFDALPAAAKAYVYQRLWDVLSGTVRDEAYAKLSLADRRAIVEILRGTRKDLPAYFQAVQR